MATHINESSKLGTLDQALMDALRGFLVPLIETVVDAKSNIDTTSEAVALIAALKQLVRDVAGVKKVATKTLVEVTLGQEDDISTDDHDIASEHPNNEPLRSPISSVLDKSSIVETQDGTLQSVRHTIKDCYLKELRDHVFNKMPIRLLSFEQHDSVLTIQLLERGSVFALVERALRSTLSQNGTRSIVEVATKDDEAKIRALVSQHAAYAILSHSWLLSTPGEVTYGDWMTQNFKANDPGYQKLVQFCRVSSMHHGLSLGWMDTVCINKDSSSELDESIRSMYVWYMRSKLCVVYLAETDSLAEISKDRWFSRGWTLQELLAPDVLKFYNRTWTAFERDNENDKKSELITRAIEKATSISAEELEDITAPLVPLSRRMQLAALREVTREEDTAYSLMGIFEVSISTAYGEGAERAFMRLLQEILNTTSMGVLDLFNWSGENMPSISHVLPTSPRHYLHRSSAIDLKYVIPYEALTVTHMGFYIPVLLMPGISIDAGHSAFIPCGNYSAVVHISPLGIFDHIPTAYRLLDSTISGHDSDLNTSSKKHQYTFVVLNIQQSGSDLFIPRTCLSIPIQCSQDVGEVTSTGAFGRIHTKDPVIFSMQKRNQEQDNPSADDYMVLTEGSVSLSLDDLERHGMQLLYKYM